MNEGNFPRALALPHKPKWLWRPLDSTVTLVRQDKLVKGYVNEGACRQHSILNDVETETVQSTAARLLPHH